MGSDSKNKELSQHIGKSNVRITLGDVFRMKGFTGKEAKQKLLASLGISHELLEGEKSLNAAQAAQAATKPVEH